MFPQNSLKHSSNRKQCVLLRAFVTAISRLKPFINPVKIRTYYVRK